MYRFFILFNMISLFLGIITPTWGQAWAARSNTDANSNIFLGGRFIEFGIAQNGSSGMIGTAVAKPAAFFGRRVAGNYGGAFLADADGFGLGADLRIDYFIPGTPAEGWALSVNGVNGLNSHTQTDIAYAFTDQTVGDLLRTTGTGTWEGITVDHDISFDLEHKYITYEVTLTNNSGAQKDNIYYMRSFDPDNTVDIGGSYTTTNTVMATHAAGDGKAILQAESGAGDAYDTYSGSRALLRYFSYDNKARLHLVPGGLMDSDAATVCTGANAKGDAVTQDRGISIGFDIGSLANGANTTFTYYVVMRSTSGTVTTNSNTDYTFYQTDFDYLDPGVAVAGVTIKTLPANGTLFIDANSDGVIDGGEEVNVNDEINDLADLNKLKYKPNADWVGKDSYTFQTNGVGDEINMAVVVRATVAYSAGANGSLTGGSPQTQYIVSGQNAVAVTATPNPGYVTRWTINSGAGNGSFSSLTANTLTITNVTGNIDVIATFKAAPTVTTQVASEIATTTATGNGNITATGDVNVTNRGVIWWAYSNTDKQIGDVGVTNVSEAGDFGTGDFTAALTSLTINTHYNARAHATNVIGTSYGTRVDFWTLAAVPPAPTIDNALSNSMEVTITAGSNPASVEFAIQETNSGNYVQVNGTLGAGVVWQSLGQWAPPILVNGLTPSTEYTFKVKARNGGGTETAFSDGTTRTTPDKPDVVTKAVSSPATTGITANGEITAINLANATNRGFIYWTYTGADKIIGDVGATNVSENGNFDVGTYNLALNSLAANTHYNLRAHATNIAGTNYGDRVDFWTLANQPAAPVVDNRTHTTLDVTISTNGNPYWTEYAIHEINTDTWIQPDGTLLDQLLWFTNAVWQDKITVKGLTPGRAYSFEVFARNGVPVMTAASPAAGATPGLLTISGKITHNGNPLPSVDVVLSGSRDLATTTDDQGDYSFTVFYYETFILTPSKTGYLFTPNYKGVLEIYEYVAQNFSAELLSYPIQGTITENDLPLSNVTVNLSGSTTAVTTTDSQGHYIFNDLEHFGNYTITPTKEHTSFTPEKRDISGLSGPLTIDFTASHHLYSIEGAVLDGDNAPVAGMSVTLTGDDDKSTTTDTEGTYRFTNLTGGGNYTVKPTAIGYIFTPSELVFNDLNQHETEQNFSAVKKTYSFSGLIFFEGQPMEGVTVTLSGSSDATIITSNRGYFYFSGLTHGSSYTVTPSLVGYAFTPSNKTVSELKSAVIQNFNAEIKMCAISGRITVNEVQLNALSAPLSDVTINLSGDESGTTLTDNNGAYQLMVKYGGQYTITPNKSGYSFTPLKRDYDGLSDDAPNQDFIASPQLPAIVQLLAPDNQAVNAPLNSTFSWHPAENAVTYTIEISRNANFENPEIQIDGIEETTYAPSDLDGYSTYYWRVRGVNPQHTGSWSAVWSFTTLMPASFFHAEIIEPDIDPTISQGQSVPLKGKPCSFNIPVIYHWDFGDTRSSEELEPGLTYFSQSGQFDIKFYYETADHQYVSDTAKRVLIVEPMSQQVRFTTVPYHRYEAPNVAILWKTGVATSANLYYGTQPDQLDQLVSVSQLKIDHSVILKDIQPGLYFYKVVATRRLMQLVSRIDSFVVTSTLSESLPPSVISMQPYFYNTYAFFFVTLNKVASVVCNYGTSPDNLSETLVGDGYFVRHKLILTGLTAGQTYYYKLTFTDLAGNVSSYPTATGLAKSAFSLNTEPFTTTQEIDIQAPGFIKSEMFLNYDRRLGLTWACDEPVSYSIQLMKGNELFTEFTDTSDYDIENILIINDLENGIDYQISLSVFDYKGNSASVSFNAQVAMDLPMAPILSEIAHTMFNGDCRIQWQTDVPATSVVRWGISDNLLDQTIEHRELTVKHDLFIDLTGIDQAVYYQVKSKLSDEVNESDWSELRMFSPVDIGEIVALNGLKPILETFGYPNPFNSQTTISYRLTRTIGVKLEIFNSLGQLVRHWPVKDETAGIQLKIWDGRDDHGKLLPSGIYFYRINTPEQITVHKLLMMK